MEFQIGDIVAYHGEQAISLIVEEVTRSAYSHVAILIDVQNGILVEADGVVGKVQYRNIKDYEGKIDIYRYKNKLTDSQREQIKNYLINQIGSKYDYMLLIFQLIRYMFGLILPYKDTPSFICSELVQDAFLEIGIKLTNYKYPSPKDISESNELIKIGNY